MPFTISPSAYRGGEMWFDALTSIGQNLGTNIGKAMQFYEQRHQALSQSDALMEQLSRTPAPGDPTGKPILDPKAYQRYMAHSAGERAAVGEGYKTALLFGNELTKASVDVNRLKAETDLYKERARALAEGDVAPDEGPITRKDASGRTWRYNTKSKQWIPVSAMPVEKEQAALADPISVTKGTMVAGAFQPAKGSKAKRDFVQIIGADGATRTYPTSRWREIKARMKQPPDTDSDLTPQQPQSGNEIKRKTADGRTAVFDKQTKKFIRWEDATAANE